MWNPPRLYVSWYDAGSSQIVDIQCIQEKVVHLIFGHNFCKCRQIFKSLSLSYSQETHH